MQEQFHRAALDAYNRHGFRSYRHAEKVTGVNYSTIYAIISRGRIPTRGQVIEWAEGLGEPINRWLDLAGYDPIPSALLENGQVTEKQADQLLRTYLKASRGKVDREKLVAHILEILEEEEREDAAGQD